MAFRGLKSILPHSLYGRAAMILLVPIVSIQLVVSVVFIQRHFNSITEQMTGAVAEELAYLVDQVNAAASLEAAQMVAATLAPALALDVSLPSNRMITDGKRFDDLTGSRVMRVLYAGVPELAGVDLNSTQGMVTLGINTDKGVMLVSFSRGRLSATNPHQLLVVMVMFGVLMTVIAYLFLRNQLRPIKRLANAAEAFGKGQVVPYRISGATEVRSAGLAFLDMRARIERHIEQRTLMLSGVSHDLSTPLTRLKLGLSMLDNCPEVDDLQRDVSDMERLVGEFLSFAQLDAEDTVPESVTPADLVRKLVEDARRGGQTVTLGEIADTGPVTLRQGPVLRALENLLTNASRFASQARLSLVAGDDDIAFVVEDDGPGIPADQRDRAQLPFARLEPSRNKDQGGGVGLGLAIATDIAREHGGKLVLAESDDLGGLRVELHLPR